MCAECRTFIPSFWGARRIDCRGASGLQPTGEAPCVVPRPSETRLAGFTEAASGPWHFTRLVLRFGGPAPSRYPFRQRRVNHASLPGRTIYMPNSRSNALPLAALALALACAFAGCAQREATPDYLHVIVKRLPQCEYGFGYEQPMRIDLVSRDVVLATSYHSGLYFGEESLWVALHVPRAYPGRYEVRFGACPSLLDDPVASAACEDVEWVSHTTATLTPSGIDNPQIVEHYRVRATCLEPEA